MKMFLIVLVLAILFVVGAAMMMQYFTGARSTKKDQSGSKQESDRK